MLKSKYIIFKRADGVEYPIVFSSLLNHSDVANRFFGESVISAGFCHIDEWLRYVCYGHSESLNVKSRNATDAHLMNTLLWCES